MDAIRSAVSNFPALRTTTTDERRRNRAADCRSVSIISSAAARGEAAVGCGNCSLNASRSLKFSKRSLQRSSQWRRGCATIRAAVAVPAEKSRKVEEIVLPLVKEISGTIKLPGSKSLSNRVLLLAALSEVSQSYFMFLIRGVIYDECLVNFGFSALDVNALPEMGNVLRDAISGPSKSGCQGN